MTGDHRRILKVQDHCKSIASFVALCPTEWNVVNSMPYKAICLDLIAIGEHVSRLSDTFITSHSHIPWRRIKNFRNIIAHDYDAIEDKYFVPIVQASVPELLNFCMYFLESTKSVGDDYSD